MKISKIKISSDKVVIVRTGDEGKTTHEFNSESYTLYSILRNNMNSIAGTVYQVSVGAIEPSSIVEAVCLDVKWDGEAVSKVKVTGTHTTAIGSGETAQNVSVQWKSKEAITADNESEFGSGADVLSKVASLIVQLS